MLLEQAGFFVPTKNDLRREYLKGRLRQFSPITFDPATTIVARAV